MCFCTNPESKETSPHGYITGWEQKTATVLTLQSLKRNTLIFGFIQAQNRFAFFKKKTQLRISHSADTLLPALGKSISIINEDVMGK